MQKVKFVWQVTPVQPQFHGKSRPYSHQFHGATLALRKKRSSAKLVKYLAKH